MRQIRAIALDLDGTLVGADHHVSVQNREAVTEAAKQGITIILSSGRPAASVEKIAEELQLSELYMVAYNGAFVKNVGTGAILVRKTILEEQRKKLTGFMRKHPQVEFLTYDDKQMLLAGREHPFASRIAEGLLLPIQELSDAGVLADRSVCKYIVAGESEALQRIEEELVRAFAGELSVIYSGGNFIEVMPPGVTKATGVAAVLRECKIQPEALMCCGDSKNDLSMMAYAGYPIAMGNAADEVRKQALYITDTCEKNGVAKAIQQILNQEQ